MALDCQLNILKFYNYLGRSLELQTYLPTGNVWFPSVLHGLDSLDEITTAGWFVDVSRFSKQCVPLHMATEDVSFCVDRWGCECL